MTRERPRKIDPTIPKHIDQRKLPPGAYWDSCDRLWYTKLGEGGKRNQRKRIAGATATVAQQHYDHNVPIVQPANWRNE